MSVVVFFRRIRISTRLETQKVAARREASDPETICLCSISDFHFSVDSIFKIDLACLFSLNCVVAVLLFFLCFNSF